MKTKHFLLAFILCLVFPCAMEEEEKLPDIHELLPYTFEISFTYKDSESETVALTLRGLTNIPVDEDGDLDEKPYYKSKQHVLHFPGRSDAAHCYWQYAIAANGLGGAKNPDNFFSIIELPSQGGSDFMAPNRLGHIDDIKTYIDAVNLSIKWAQKVSNRVGANLHISSHSMSSQFVLIWLSLAEQKNLSRIKAFHFFTPMIGFSTGMLPYELVYAVAFSAYNVKYIGDVLCCFPVLAQLASSREWVLLTGPDTLEEKAKEIVHSEQGQQMYVKLWQKHKDLIVGPPTVGWIYNCLKGREYLLNSDPKLFLKKDIALHFYQSPFDKVVDNEDTDNFINGLFAVDRKAQEESNGVQKDRVSKRILSNHDHHPFFDPDFSQYLKRAVFKTRW